MKCVMCDEPASMSVKVTTKPRGRIMYMLNMLIMKSTPLCLPHAMEFARNWQDRIGHRVHMKAVK